MWGGLVVSQDLAPQPSTHLGLCPHTLASRVFVSSIFTTAHAGALPWTHFKPGLPLSFGPCKPLRSLPTPLRAAAAPKPLLHRG